MKQENREKAKELAQTFNGQVRRGDVERAFEEGYTNRQVRRAVRATDQVGDKVTPYLDERRQTSREEANTGADAKIRSAALPGTAGGSVMLDKDGRFLQNSKDGADYLTGNREAYVKATYGGQYRYAAPKSAEKLNTYLEENDLYLNPGKKGEWVMAGNQKVTLDRHPTSVAWMSMGGGSGANAGSGEVLDQTKAWVPVYRRVDGGNDERRRGGSDEPRPDRQPTDIPSIDPAGGAGTTTAGTAPSGYTSTSTTASAGTGSGTSAGGSTGTEATPYTGNTAGTATTPSRDFGVTSDTWASTGLRQLTPIIDQMRAGINADIANNYQRANTNFLEWGELGRRWGLTLPKAPELDSAKELVDQLNRAGRLIEI